MAGRGTDIMLGGNVEFLTFTELAKRGISAEENPGQYQQAWDEVYAQTKLAVEEEAQKVLQVGGLYVLGTERHESRRIDNQLRGRAGRQGDKGESRFYLSLTDDLMRLFSSGAAGALMNRPGIPDDIAIESKLVSRSIQSAQGQVEARNAEIRKNVLKYDDVLNRQREAIYGDRRHILEGDNIETRVDEFLESAVAEIVRSHISDSAGKDWDLEQLWTELRAIYPIGLEIEEVLAEAGSRSRLTTAWLSREIVSDARIAYQARTAEIGEQAMRELERRVVLSVIDRKWRDHLYEMDYLKEGIGLRAMAQRDPLVEYQREGYGMYQQMMGSIREECIGFLFNLEVQVEESGDHTEVEAPGLEPHTDNREQLTYIAPNEDGETEVHPGKRAQTNTNVPPAQANKNEPPAQGSAFFKN
jgi:preprotein translocase subunit SecA